MTTNTATKRALMCTARNVDGSVSDRHVFNVLSVFCIFMCMNILRNANEILVFYIRIKLVK